MTFRNAKQVLYVIFLMKHIQYVQFFFLLLLSREKQSRRNLDIAVVCSCSPRMKGNLKTIR